MNLNPDVLPQWKWEDLETVLQQTLSQTPHRMKVQHLLEATRDTAQALSATELLREVLALGAIAYTLTASGSPRSRPGAFCQGSA